ncbi:PIN domain nuclease [Sulfolobus sp. S-194]|uniref:type II toxin-antitoxin system VapC family toxin n=1 Tax=Sulfolobus sp. S-194 TaxID=2512240 RepID=UPI001437093B|nr:PIN domain nuclease [Sulfolobus sp. S-194]QIW24721.1 PIN domain nuclease [Sulfolobus sp. S-194]
MRDEFLLDASALYPILSYIDKIDVTKIYVIPLTFYKVGNAIWKEYYLKNKDPITLCALFQKFMSKLKLLDNPPAEEIMRVTSEKELTFYDATYVYSAESYGLFLVS